MPLNTKRWDDPVEENDGKRILICRYRPRGVKKELEAWDVWWPEVAPSVELHAAAYAKNGISVSWDIYARRYRTEMRQPEAQARIQELAQRLRKGERITLLCSSACVRESRCHRSLLAELVEEAMNATT